jgi:predicted nucleic acid-binding Zn ribbon protein
MNDDSITLCPKCEGEVKKIYSPPLIQFKGTGWYVTDYANKKDHLRQKAKEKETTE